MSVRLPIAITALAATFTAGVAASQLWVRDAHAQQVSPFAATVYIPSDGIAFRTFDGHVVARLSYDAHGGQFELFDEREQPTVHVRADAFSRVAPASTPTPFVRPKSDPDLGF